MKNSVRQIENNKGKEVLSVIEKWMEIHFLELREMNGLYELYSKAIEDKIYNIEDEDKLIEVIVEYVDENLIKALDLFDIKYPNRLVELTKEPMAENIEEETIILELDNQRYKVLSWIGNLDCKGCYTTSNWIDFNSIKRI